MKYFCFFSVFFLVFFSVHSRYINSGTPNASKSGVAPPTWSRTTITPSTVTRGEDFVGKLVTESSAEDGLHKRFMITAPDRCGYQQQMIMGKCRTIARSSKEVKTLEGNTVKLSKTAKTTRDSIHSKDDDIEPSITLKEGNTVKLSKTTRDSIQSKVYDIEPSLTFKNRHISYSMILTENRCKEPLKLIRGKCRVVA